MYNVTELCFSRGGAKDPAEWSNYIWYINVLGENDTNALFSIKDICRGASEAAGKMIEYGSVNGGTTIQLPFGFVQWHQEKMQFHQKYDRIKALAEEY